MHCSKDKGQRCICVRYDVNTYCVELCSESSQSMMTFSFWFASSLAMNCFYG